LGTSPYGTTPLPTTPVYAFAPIRTLAVWFDPAAGWLKTMVTEVTMFRGGVWGARDHETPRVPDALFLFFI
jgi:hypothetical protein